MLKTFHWCLSLHQLKNNVSTRDLNNNTPSAPPENVCMQFLEKRSARLMRMLETCRPLKTRITEHKRAVSMLDHDSKISCNVHEHKHIMDFESVKVVGHEANYHERLFLGSLVFDKESAVWK